MLIAPREAIAECVERITSEFFFFPAHQIIYDRLVELWTAGKGIDLVTFTQHLNDRKELDTIGGATFLTSLYTFTPTSELIIYYLEIVREKFILRKIIATCTDAIGQAFGEFDDANRVLDEVERAVLKIRPHEPTRQRLIKEDVMEALDAIESLYNRQGKVTGLSTGFHELDRILNGLQPHEMFILAARPSMGKTSLALNIAEHVAVIEKKPVLIFSLEMSRQQLVQRMLCARARINTQKLREGFLTDRDFPALTAAASKLAESPLYIIDERLIADSLIARARRMIVERKIQLVVVDYLQLLHARGFKPDHRRLEIAYISAALKGLATDHAIPVLCVAQLNRSPEARTGGKPRLSDLRESGDIEQDADVVALLVRAEAYAEDEEEKTRLCGEAELIIAKQRNGPTGEIPLTFIKEYTRFEDRARDVEESLL